MSTTYDPEILHRHHGKLARRVHAQVANIPFTQRNGTEIVNSFGIVVATAPDPRVAALIVDCVNRYAGKGKQREAR